MSEIESQRNAPTPSPLHAVEKWYSPGGVIKTKNPESIRFVDHGGMTMSEACEATLRMANALKRTGQRMPTYLTATEPYVSDTGEVVGMNWIMPDWEHFERMLVDD